jgi:RNA polymerase sigma-70 factor (ECF subfamily)
MGPPPDLKWAPDKDVVASALAGRQAAYGELLRRYERLVLAFIYRMVPHRERAEDLTQETFAKAFNALDRYRPERSFAPWILRIARNAAVDYLRYKRFDSWDSLLLDTPGHIDASAVAPATASDTPAPDPDTRRFAAALEQALRRLRPEYRRCIILRDVEERSYDEIATIMRLPAGTVATYIHRARKQLRELLPPLAPLHR